MAKKAAPPGHYPRDSGPLSEARQRKIAEIVREKHGDAKVTESLFDEPVTGTRPHAALNQDLGEPVVVRKMVD